MSFAYSRKHWRQMFSPYFLMRPHWLEQTRLQGHSTWVSGLGKHTSSGLKGFHSIREHH